MTAVYRSGRDDVFIEQPRGLFYVISPEGAASHGVFTLPADAVELLDPDEGRAAVLADVAVALADVKMSKAARAAIADILDKLGPS